MPFLRKSGIEIRYGSAIPHRAHCSQGTGASPHFVKNDEERVMSRSRNRMPVCNRDTTFPTTPPIRSPMPRRSQRLRRAYQHAGQCREPHPAATGIVRDSQRSPGMVFWHTPCACGALSSDVICRAWPPLGRIRRIGSHARLFQAGRQSSNIRRNHSECLRFFRT